MMEDNIINTPGFTIIMNGGNPLEGCPKDWDEAKAIELKLNNGIEKDNTEGPEWSFDCGFKLDYDGPLISVSSRFYPPKTHYGATWDGRVTVLMMGDELSEKKFDCKTLEELKAEVEAHVKTLTDKIKELFKH